jgi:hypothetical protein
MSFQDVTNILLGQQDAATLYFKRTTSNLLADKFRPIINNSLSSQPLKTLISQSTNFSLC